MSSDASPDTGAPEAKAAGAAGSGARAAKALGASSPENASPEKLALWKNRYEFDASVYTDADLLEIMWQLWDDAGIPEATGMERAQWDAFFLDVKTEMEKFDNPYHNFRHVCDVAQFMHAMLEETGLSDQLLPHEKAAVITAALCHDLAHPGYANWWVKATNHEYFRANSTSPNESHHTKVALELMEKHGVLEPFDEDEQAAMKSITRQMILATDMGRHGELYKKFGELVATLPHASGEEQMNDLGATGDADEDGLDEESRQRLDEMFGPVEEPADAGAASAAGDVEGGGSFADAMAAWGGGSETGMYETLKGLWLAMALKIADISNLGRPWDAACYWNRSVYAEFFREGESNRAAGRVGPKGPPAMVNALQSIDPNVEGSDIKISKSSCGFMAFVVIPLSGQFLRFLECAQQGGIGVEPEGFSTWTEMLEKNLERHKAVVAAAARAEAEAANAAAKA
jgi:hypothetical protein